MLPSCDAVVVGAGPAGSMTALLLARLGRRVILVDRGPRDRVKTCGHCLGARAVPLLARHGLLSATRAAAGGATRRLAVRIERRPALEVALDRDGGEAGRGMVIDRRRLDPLLQDEAIRAGVELRCPAIAHAVRMRGDGTVDVDLREPCGRAAVVRAELVVGADGVGSGVARRLGWASARSAGRRLGVSFQCSTSEGERAVPPDTVAMFVRRNGYLGAVRQDGAVHVAALVHGSTRLDAVRDAFADELPWLPGSFRTAPGFAATGPLPWRPSRIAAAGAALVGDAAGYAEPFTGEGMTWALESAELLATAVDAHGRLDGDAAAAYALAWQAHIGRGQRRCLLLAEALERPWLLRVGAAACRWLPPLSERLVRRVVAA